MSFSDAFLDELRAAVPVSRVVGRSFELVKAGKELQAKTDKSLTVNDQKRIWKDFGKGGQDGGDVFAWFVQRQGMTFPDAVAEVASMAGIPLPTNGAASPRKPRDDIPWDDGAPPVTQAPEGRGARTERQITKTYDYTDTAGSLLYQVCRIEWEADGKKRKTFSQRRPLLAAGGDVQWAWGLAAGDYIQSRSGDWYVATKDRIDKWTGAPKRRIDDDVPHGLYRLVEFKEEATPDEPAFIAEGEKDVDTLRSWGYVATTNSGGAANWRDDHAEMFRGLDVIIAIDNDDAGRKRGDKIAASLRRFASRVRILDFAKVWPGAPTGADVTDWKQQREGDAEELRELLPDLPLWSPPAFISKFGGIPFERLDDPGPEHEYLIDGWLTVGDKSVIGGPSKSGKSFLSIHASGCIATGRPFFDCEVMTPGLVIYQAGEGARGVRKRFRAWRQYHGIEPKAKVPIYILQSKIDLWRTDGDTPKLIEEIRGIQSLYDVPLRALFIDTLATATGGADENSGKDMSMVMANIDKIALACPGVNVCLVHHFNAAGTKLRGHSSIYNNIDQVVLVTKEESGKVRTAVLDKQKDGEDGAEIKFELYVVTLGHRLDGKAITSCVTIPSGMGNQSRIEGKGGLSIKLTNERNVILQALRNAIGSFGEKTPLAMKLPKSIRYVVHAQHWRSEYVKLAADPAIKDNTINARIRRASEQFQALRIIGRENPYVWLTGRAIGLEVIVTNDDDSANDPTPEGPSQPDMMGAAPEPE